MLALPPLYVLYRGAAVSGRSAEANQASLVLMGDCLLCRLVVCHVEAAFPEVSRFLELLHRQGLPLSSGNAQARKSRKSRAVCPYAHWKALWDRKR